MSDPLIEKARAFALRAHENQYRKGRENKPYFTHLVSVAERLQAHGYQHPTTISAAFLHDVLEDQPQYTDELTREFPVEVIEVVQTLTEKKTDAHGNKRPKSQRFSDYVLALEQNSPGNVHARAISCADKIDNLQSILDAQHQGDDILSRLSTRPGQYKHHVETLRKLYAGSVNSSLLVQFDETAEALFAYIHRWASGHAVAIASNAHRAQFDKSGQPYVLHPLRLMSKAATYEEKMAAVLHDVVEDTPWTFEQLADEGIPDTVIAALRCLTKQHGESYEVFIDRVLTNPLATRVKLLDIEDNLDTTRLSTLTERDLERIQKYHRARKRILDAISQHSKH